MILFKAECFCRGVVALQKHFFILCVSVQKVSNWHIYVTIRDQLGVIPSFIFQFGSLSGFTHIYAYLYRLLHLTDADNIHSYL